MGSFLVVGAFIVLWAVFSLIAWKFGRDQRIKREMREVTLFPIRDAPENKDIRITGKLRLAEDRTPLTAPLSGRPCAAWRVLVRERRGSSKNRRWVTLIEEEESMDFVLEDETGVASIDGSLLSVVVDIDASGGVGLFSSSDRLERFLEERGIATAGLVFKKTFDFKEGVLEEGEQVTVTGSGTWEADPTQRAEGYRGVGRRLRLRAMQSGRMLATDHRDLAG